MNTNVLKTSNNHTNKLVSMTTSNNSKIFLRLLWFLLLKDSPTSTPVKKPSAWKSLCMFTKVLKVKKTAYYRVGDAKSKRKAVKFGSTSWALKQKRKGNSKINEQIKKSLYNWIMHHPQVTQSPIVNDCLKVKIDGHTEP